MIGTLGIIVFVRIRIKPNKYEIMRDPQRPGKVVANIILVNVNPIIKRAQGNNSSTEDWIWRTILLLVTTGLGSAPERQKKNKKLNNKISFLFQEIQEMV